MVNIDLVVLNKGHLRLFIHGPLWCSAGRHKFLCTAPRPKCAHTTRDALVATVCTRRTRESCIKVAGGGHVMVHRCDCSFIFYLVYSIHSFVEVHTATAAVVLAHVVIDVLGIISKWIQKR